MNIKRARYVCWTVMAVSVAMYLFLTGSFVPSDEVLQQDLFNVAIGIFIASSFALVAVEYAMRRRVIVALMRAGLVVGIGVLVVVIGSVVIALSAI
jgi:hypothetical protein